MGGKACIRGLRVTVGMVVGQIGAGDSIDEVLSDYPYLEREDVMQALRYAAWRAEDHEIVLGISEGERNRITEEAHSNFLKSGILIRDVFGSLGS